MNENVTREVNLDILRQRAYNLRWATLPADVIPFTAADPDYPGPVPVAEALARYAADRYWSYAPAEGITSFRESMARFYNEQRSVPARAAHVIATDSAAYGIYVVCKATLQRGDEAIIFDPVDFLFNYSIEQMGATAVRYATPQTTDAMTFAGLEDLITPKTKLICLCNPLNPTGKVFSRQELTILGDIAVKYGLTILSDEIWSDIIFSPYSFTSIAALDEEIRKRTVIVTGFSKTYGLAGLRIGALTSFTDDMHRRLMEASLHNSTIHGANTAGQVAATAALDECGDWVKSVLVHLTEMKDLCVGELNTMKGVSCLAPQGCYVAFANVTATGRSSTDIADLLMSKARVAVVPGRAEWFGPGAEGYIRLSFATNGDILQEGLRRIKQTLDSL